MTDKKNIFGKLSSFLKKDKSDSDSAADAPASTEARPRSQSDPLESTLAEANHDVADFTTGLNASKSLIASSHLLQVNGERFLAAHIVGFKDTLSGIAFKYYGKASEPYYRLIYEANKEIIGANMNLLRVGQTLNIPKLPEELSED